jgi:hypothetical protein
MFQLKNKEALFGINKEASDHGTPVFEKNLDAGIMAEANRDGTIFVQKGLGQKQINDAVAHEKVHLEQMAQGKLDYTNDHVIWKKDTKSPMKMYNRRIMAEGAHNLPWEKEAYQKTKK